MKLTLICLVTGFACITEATEQKPATKDNLNLTFL